MNEKKNWADYPDGLRMRVSRLLWTVVAIIVFILCTSFARAQDRLCFPSTAWFGSQAPTIDGIVVGDVGWQRAFHAELGPTGDPDAVVQGIRDTNKLYLSVQANKLDSINSGNPGNNPPAASVVVLTFDSGGGQFQQIQIQPVISNAQPASSGLSGPIKFWTGTASGSGVSWTAVTPPPPWLLTGNVKVSYTQDTAGAFPFHWYLEMALPFQIGISPGLALPNGFFRLYIDVFRVVSAEFQQTSWPPGQTETGCPSGTAVGTCTPDQQTPAVTSWGISTIDASQTCSLVNVQSISVTNATNVGGTLIDVSTSNTFKVQVQNNPPPPGTGLPDTAKQVSATFSIANFGISSLPAWQAVPTSNNPTAPADLPPGPTTVSPSPWTVSLADQPKYDPNAPNSHPHQCIRVQLSSNDSNTAFTNNPAFQNMDFVAASKFERTAEISAKGYPLPPGQTDQLFDLYVLTREEVLKPGQAMPAFGQATTPATPAQGTTKGRVISQLTWIAEGCRHTGRYMTVDNQTLELCDPVGAFGYVVRHVGLAPVENWRLEFTGKGLEKVPGTNNVYRLHVTQDGVATVTTQAEPKEQKSAGQGKVAVFLDAGAGIPHGTFGNAFNTGFSLNAGLEYIATSHFSVEGIFGYHHFPAKVGSALNLYQFSVNAKAYLTTSGSVRPFVNGGIGGYKFSPGPTNFGGDFGGGVLYNITAHWGLQGSYNFHAVNTPVAATKFSTLQGGIRFVF